MSSTAQKTPDVSPDPVREQLARLMASPYFSNSKRYPALLGYIVEAALENRSSSLKERVLGVEVFHRPADYDTNVDPVVRIAAGEVRKRLAQYYCEPAHGAEMRIDLPSGSYVPEFHHSIPSVSDPGPLTAAAPCVPEVFAAAEVPTAARPFSYRRWKPILAIAAAAILVVLCVEKFTRRSAIDEFWGPVLKSSSVLICIGQPDSALPRSTDDTVYAHTINQDQLALGDAIAATHITTVLGNAGVAYSMQGVGSTTFSDMRKGPVVLVSGADNAWTLRVTDPLRFHFVVTGQVVHIEDRQNPSNRDWALDFGIPLAQLRKDYAIVGRFLDQTTGQYVVVAAGIGVNGTLCAGELIGDKRYLETLLSSVPKGTNSFEAVISTQVIEGKSGPPSVLAVHSWNSAATNTVSSASTF